MTLPQNNFEEHLEKLKREYAAQLPAKLAVINADWHLLCQKWQTDVNVVLHRNIHSLIGTSGTFGFLDLSRVAREFELLIKPLLAITDDNFLPDLTLREQVNKKYQQLLALVKPAEKTEDIPYLLSSEPLNNSSSDNNEATLNNAINDTNTSIKIYYVDDKLSTADLLHQALVNYGFDATLYSNLTDLHHATDKNPPHLVIMSLTLSNLPHEDIYTIARAFIRAKIKVILLSGPNNFVNRLNAVRTGIQAYIPYATDSAAVIESIRDTFNLTREKTSKILIVDDQESVVSFYELLLKKEGFNVKTETNPLNVLNVLENFHPDLMLFDLNMPIVSGDELAAVIRQDTKHKAIPIIFLTAEENINNQTRALVIEPQEIIQKGLSPDEFINQIKYRIAQTKTIAAMRFQDNLTGLLNHANIQLAGEQIFEHNKEKKLTFCIALINIDNVKQINTQFGHLTGDRIIKTVAQLFQQHLNPIDIMGRLGGDEFMLILPERSITDAANLINHLRKSFAAITFGEEKSLFNASFSAGVAENIGLDDFNKHLTLTHEALFRAKQRGKNVVCANFAQGE